MLKLTLPGLPSVLRVAVCLVGWASQHWAHCGCRRAMFPQYFLDPLPASSLLLDTQAIFPAPTAPLILPAGAVTGRGVSRVGYQTAEAMVVRKGFSVEQLRECLEEYADLSVVQVRHVDFWVDVDADVDVDVHVLFMFFPWFRPCRCLLFVCCSYSLLFSCRHLRVFWMWFVLFPPAVGVLRGHL